MENDGQLLFSSLASSAERPDLISIQNLLALAWLADVKFMVVFLNGSGPRHIYFRWRSTFLWNESEITRLAVIRFIAGFVRNIFSKRTRFQAFGPFLVLNIPSCRTDRLPIVSYSQSNGKSLLTKLLRALRIFLHYVLRWSLVVSQLLEYWRVLWEFSLSRRSWSLKQSIMFLNEQRTCTESCTTLFF